MGLSSRNQNLTLTARASYHGKIQDHPPDFYMQFAIIIAGLDSISARRWINATLVNMVDEENQDSLKPLIDGGTEGFKGQARVILPTITSCYECSVSLIYCFVASTQCSSRSTCSLPPPLSPFAPLPTPLACQNTA